MKKILHVISSPRGNASNSIQLGNTIVDQLLAAHPGSTVKVRNLPEQNFPHLEEAHITSFFTPAESRTPELVAAAKHSDDAIAELMEADIIVIGVPIYNYSIHSTLKAWLDHIVRAGVTFKYEASGPMGLVHGKKMYIAMASGGLLSEGSMKALDFAEPYLRTIFGFIGITDITVYRIEGLALPELKDKAVEKGLASVMLT